MKPATAVLGAIREGHTTAASIASATGLRETMVATLLEHLKRDGILAADAPSCGTDGHCLSCAVATSCGSRQLLTLRLRPPS